MIMLSRRSWRCLAAVAAVAVVAGCSTHPGIPPSVIHRATPAAAAGATAAGRPAVGVDLYAQRAYPATTVLVDGDRALAYIKSLGATSVGLVWNLYSPGLNSDRVEQSPKISLSPAAVAELTKAAEADGLTVQYRPLVRVGPRQLWEGRIRPVDQAAWFASLYHAEVPYLEDAQQLHVAQVVAGTELYGLNTSPSWPAFLAMTARVYTGPVTVAEYQTSYLHGRLVPVDGVIGVDPYPDLPLANDASQGRVTAAWEGWFAPVPASTRERTDLDEVGFNSIYGGYQAPSRWQLRGTVDWVMQARWFTAACRTVAHYRMAGIWFYEINLAVDPDRANSFTGFFAHRPGAAAIRACAKTLR
jgi:hypothetical protein